MTARFALLGEHLSHSFSPRIHAAFGGYEYTLRECAKSELETLLHDTQFDGFNVTIPYKKDVIPFINRLSDSAAATGSVNTVVRHADGTLFGDNTDVAGFSAQFRKSKVDVNGKKALVLGSGGAGAAAAYALKRLGANVVTISRSGENNYSNLEKHCDAALIVNATPVGMYPNNGVSPLTLTLFPQLEFVFDLIYNPARTSLLLEAKRLNIPCCNGLYMLVSQAADSYKVFTGSSVSEDKIVDIYRRLAAESSNIVLIGMPGCGKTTLAKNLGQKLSRKIIDADREIELKYHITPAEIITSQGERRFRQIELETLKELGKQTGIVISTGGGCVETPEAYEALKQNGLILWLKRDINSLSTFNRPISKTVGLEELYRRRKQLYAAFADAEVQVCRSKNSTLNAALDAIAKLEEQL